MEADAAFGGLGLTGQVHTRPPAAGPAARAFRLRRWAILRYGSPMRAYSEGVVLGLALGGWGVVAYVVAALPVTPTTQAILYAAGFAALAGSWALLLELYQARRGGSNGASPAPRPGAIALLGSGMRFAFALEFALWLQSLRMLTPLYLALLLACYLLVEYLFRAAGSGAR